MKKRKHFFQVPDPRILKKIIKTEQKRPVSKEKENLHFVDFKLLKLWLEAINIPTDFLKQKNWQVMLDLGRKLQSQVVRKTLALVLKKDPEVISLLNKISRYLGEQDIKEKVDLIFVFGSKDLGRIRKAVSLWRKGLAEKILIAGRARFDERERQQPEALVFKKEALKLGVPEEIIITEPDSITIADNVRSGLNLLDKKGIKYRKIMTIVYWYAQKRAWSHLIKYVPEGTRIVRVNSDIQNKLLTQENWYKNEIGLNVVFSEYLKLKMGVMLNTI